MEKNYPIDTTLSDVVNKKCPILCAMDVIGSKWKLPIIWYLHEKENTRFNELKRRIPRITARNGKRRTYQALRVHFDAAKGRGVFIDAFRKGIDTRAE